MKIHISSASRLGVFAALTVYLGMAWGALAVPPSYEHLEEQLSRHPSLQQLRLERQATIATARAAKALPDPVIMLGVNNVPISDPSFDRFLPSNKAIGVRQSLPNKRMRRAKSAVVLGVASAQEVETAHKFSQLREKLISLLIDQKRIEAQIDLAQQRDKKYAELQDVIRTEIDAGRAVVFRLAQVDIERAEVARTIVNFEGDLTTTRAQLVDLVGEAPETDPPMIIALGWQGNTEDFFSVRLAKAGIDIAAAGVEKARAEYGPDWGLNLTYQQREEGGGSLGSSFAGDDWFSAQVTFTVPLWAREKQTPNLNAARGRKEAAAQRLNAMARRSEAEWHALKASQQAASQSVLVFEEKLRAIEDKISLSLTMYASGASDYSPILDAEIARLRFRAQIILEKARRDKAIVRANSLLVTS